MNICYACKFCDAKKKMKINKNGVKPNNFIIGISHSLAKLNYYIQYLYEGAV